MWVMALVGSLLGPAGAAWAEDDEDEISAPIDAAARANEVNQTYCGDAYSRDMTLATENTSRVADAWFAVSKSYDAHDDAPYLLFWRAVLAQCLNRTEEAYADFDQFIAAHETEGSYADLVRQAKQRMRRLGRKKELGDGPAAQYLQSHQVLEIGVSYAAGLQVLSEVCRGRADLYLDGGCSEGENTVWKNAAAGQPAGVDLALAFYPVRLGKGKVHFSPGLSGRFSLAATTSAAVAEEEGLAPQQIGPMWSLLVGPTLRFQQSAASGSRGIRLQVVPGFHMRHGRISPLAGAINMNNVGLLNAGTYGWTLPGVAMSAELTVETGRAMAVRFGATCGFDVEQSKPALNTVVPYDDETLTGVPDPASLGDAGFAGGHVGLLIAFGEGRFAFAPALRFGWSTTQLSYPDLTPEQWQEFFVTDETAAEVEDRKVYSTRQDLYSIVLELGIRFGAAAR
jgi:hypothetical protein